MATWLSSDRVPEIANVPNAPATERDGRALLT
jgi:hypothetical protein